MGIAFSSPLLITSHTNYLKGVVHGILCMHADTYAFYLPAHGSDIVNRDIVNSYGGGYNAWDVPQAEFIKFQKVSMKSHLEVVGCS